MILCQEINIPLVFWHVMDGGKDSVDLLEELLDCYGDAVSHDVVKNNGRGNRFCIFENFNANENAMAADARIIELDQFYPGTMNKIDEKNSSFWAAVNNKELQAGRYLNLLECRRVRVWLESGYRTSDELGWFLASSEAPESVQLMD